MVSTVRPNARAIAEVADRRTPARTAAPQPPKTSQKVPKNSAASRRPIEYMSPRSRSTVPGRRDRGPAAPPPRATLPPSPGRRRQRRTGRGSMLRGWRRSGATPPRAGLDAAEAASPVEAVEAVTRELGLALGATQGLLPHRRPVGTGPGPARARPAGAAEGRRRRARSGRASGGRSRSPRRCCRSTAGRPSRRCAPRRCRSSRPSRAGSDGRRAAAVAGAGPGDRARRGHRPPGADPPRRAEPATRWARSRGWRTCWRSW